VLSCGYVTLFVTFVRLAKSVFIGPCDGWMATECLFWLRIEREINRNAYIFRLNYEDQMIDQMSLVILTFQSSVSSHASSVTTIPPHWHCLMKKHHRRGNQFVHVKCHKARQLYPKNKCCFWYSLHGTAICIILFPKGQSP
jgi:hypothetical protein